MFLTFFKKFLMMFMSSDNREKAYVMTERISENFNLSEFKVSSSYPDVAKEMKISEEVEENIIELTTKILQPVREMLAEIIEILSGYRNDKLNNLINGVLTSDHSYGMAADITSPEIREKLKKVAHKIWKMGLPIRQLIYYPEQGFIHISINTVDKPYKNEFMYKKNGNYYYEEV